MFSPGTKFRAKRATATPFSIPSFRTEFSSSMPTQHSAESTLHWVLTIEPDGNNPLNRRPKDEAVATERRIATLRKTASLLEAQLAPIVGFRVLPKAEAFQFFSYLFNLEPWAEHVQLREDRGPRQANCAERGEAGGRTPASRQALRPDVLAVGHAGNFSAVPVRRPHDTRLRQHPLHELAAKVCGQGPHGNCAAGEVHQFLQDRRS